MSVIYSGDNITFDDGSTLSTGYTHFRNRIINGDMRIAQRTTSVQTVNTAAGDVFPVDRFHAFTSNPYSGAFSIQQSTDVPTGQGFANSVVITTSTADSSLTANELAGFRQVIEAYNIADLNWGTANAKAASLSFWAKSSVAGTHSGVITTGNWTQTYGFTYTLSNANTWQYVTIENIPGPTTGDWGGNSTGRGIQIVYNLGAHSGNLVSSGWTSATNGVNTGVTGSVQLVSTLNANLYITGVQFERGAKATTFERRLIGQELTLCQRYYYRARCSDLTDMWSSCLMYSTTLAMGVIPFPVTMRIAPTALETSGTATDYRVLIPGGNVVCNGVPTYDKSTQWNGFVYFNVASGLTTGQAGLLRSNSTTSAFLGWSAEL
jgi:hypothetical protein